MPHGKRVPKEIIFLVSYYDLSHKDIVMFLEFSAFYQTISYSYFVITKIIEL